MERRKEEEEEKKGENNPGARDCLQMRTEEQMKIHFQNKGSTPCKGRAPEVRKMLQVNASLNSFFTCIMKYGMISGRPVHHRPQIKRASQSMQNHVKAFAFYSVGDALSRHHPGLLLSILSHILMQSHSQTHSARRAESEMRWIFAATAVVDAGIIIAAHPLLSQALVSPYDSGRKPIIWQHFLLLFQVLQKVNSL